MIRLIVIAGLALLCGCALPSIRFERATKAVERSERAAATNHAEQVAAGRDFTFAADYALSLDPMPSRPSQVAHDMTGRSLLASGLPGSAEAVRLRMMVSDLISTNQEQRTRGEKALEGKDRQIAELQSRAEVIGAKLQASEDRLQAISRENASLADRWARLSRMFWIVVWIGVALALLWLATIILPFFVPAVGPALGTMKRLVAGIQSYRASKDPNADLDSILKQSLDEGDRWRIAQIKRRIGSV